ncbi:MAG: hypothetical protein KJ850_11370 [Gammaproteobacteria bacterium]|nr:hypothetical protein [Gammaproteobacteria bacterium]MBU1625629.1 hypothetical protein [Gammaproteobacteria bacterium]MBU1980889.1 hypothetical protein [Gammaproteobacteria bacterium]
MTHRVWYSECKSEEELEEGRQKELAAQEEKKRPFEADKLIKQQQEKQAQAAAEAAKPKPAVSLDKLELKLDD